MPMKTADSLDAVPESFRSAAFETKDGKFVYAEDEDVSGLKSALQKEREAKREAENRAKQLADEAAKADLSAKGLLEAKQKWDEEHLKPVKTELEAKAALVARLQLENPVKDLMRAAGMYDAEDGWRLLGDQFELVDGKPILKADPTADIAKYLTTTLKAKKPHLFKGTAAGGSGAEGGGSDGTAPATGDPRKWTQAQKNAYFEQHGAAKYGELVAKYAGQKTAA